MRVVEVAVGYEDSRWELLNVEIPEEEGEVLSEYDLLKIAEDEAIQSLEGQVGSVVFVHGLNVFEADEDNAAF